MITDDITRSTCRSTRTHLAAYNWTSTFERLERTLMNAISRYLKHAAARKTSQSPSTSSNLFGPNFMNPGSSPAEKGRKSSSIVRYAKIGAVGLGVGAVLAVTGGMAAPAIAGAMLLMGTTSAGLSRRGLSILSTNKRISECLCRSDHHRGHNGNALRRHRGGSSELQDDEADAWAAGVRI